MPSAVYGLRQDAIAARALQKAMKCAPRLVVRGLMADHAHLGNLSVECHGFRMQEKIRVEDTILRAVVSTRLVTSRVAWVWIFRRTVRGRLAQHPDRTAVPVLSLESCCNLHTANRPVVQ